jgi:hypothetical protein
VGCGVRDIAGVGGRRVVMESAPAPSTTRDEPALPHTGLTGASTFSASSTSSTRHPHKHDTHRPTTLLPTPWPSHPPFSAGLYQAPSPLVSLRPRYTTSKAELAPSSSTGYLEFERRLWPREHISWYHGYSGRLSSMLGLDQGTSRRRPAARICRWLHSH